MKGRPGHCSKLRSQSRSTGHVGARQARTPAGWPLSEWPHAIGRTRLTVSRSAECAHVLNAGVPDSPIRCSGHSWAAGANGQGIHLTLGQAPQGRAPLGSGGPSVASLRPVPDPEAQSRAGGRRLTAAGAPRDLHRIQSLPGLPGCGLGTGSSLCSLSPGGASAGSRREL